MVHTICVDINFLLKYVQVFNVMFFGLYTSLLFMLMFHTSYCFCLHMYLHQLQVPSTGHNQEKCIQEGKIFCTYSHSMRPEGASNEAINTLSIEEIMKQQ